jgi:hypothetical protein
VRLLEKLKQENQDSVGPIAEGVWRRLNGVGGSSSSEPHAFWKIVSLAELRIVEDVMKVDGPMSILVSGLKREV